MTTNEPALFDDDDPGVITWPDDPETARRMRVVSQQVARTVVAERTALEQVLASKFSHAHKLELLYALAGEAKCPGCANGAHEAIHLILNQCCYHDHDHPGMDPTQTVLDLDL